MSFDPRSLARTLGCLLAAAALLPAAAGQAQPRSREKQYTADFGEGDCVFADVGRNRFFVLEPGHRLRLEGRTPRGFAEVSITVLDQTRLIGGVVTRVVEEEDRLDGRLVGVTRSFHAICTQTLDVYQFGTEVALDAGDDGPVPAGSWMAGESGARPGVAMPGRFLLGSRYQIEVAPGVALDRAENVSMDASVATPAGTFTGCAVTLETTPLEPGEQALRAYAEGIGLVADEDLRLVAWTPAVAKP